MTREKAIIGDHPQISSLVSWRETKFKFVSRIIAGGTPQSDNPDYWDGPIIWLTPVDLGNKGSDAICDSARRLTTAGVKAAGLEILPSGTVVISTRAPIGSVGLLACEATTNQGCKAVIPEERLIDSKFTYYLALDSAEKLRSLGLGTTFVELSTYALKNFRLCLPNVIEQRHIASYLDKQTAKIDRLIRLRQRQIELLREQRAALIQQAVTRGLNPDVTMKDSSIPWLGEIPAHWSVLPLGRLSTVLQTGPFGSQLHADEYIEGGIPVINPSHLEDGRIIHDPKCSVTAATASRLARHTLFEGDVVFARRGDLGRCGLVTVEEVGWLCGTGSLLMRPHKYALEPAYLVSLFQLRRLKEALSLHSVGATMENLNTGILARIRLPLPSCHEQREILNHIGFESSRIEALITAYKHQITLLQEYRSSLIHECVTGQRSATS